MIWIPLTTGKEFQKVRSRSIKHSAPCKSRSSQLQLKKKRKKKIKENFQIHCSRSHSVLLKLFQITILNKEKAAQEN